MKETIRQQLETLLRDLSNRIEQLQNQEDEYRKDGNYSPAQDRKSRRSALIPIKERIEDILNP